MASGARHFHPQMRLFNALWRTFVPAFRGDGLAPALRGAACAARRQSRGRRAPSWSLDGFAGKDEGGNSGLGVPSGRIHGPRDAPFPRIAGSLLGNIASWNGSSGLTTTGPMIASLSEKPKLLLWEMLSARPPSEAVEARAAVGRCAHLAAACSFARRSAGTRQLRLFARRLVVPDALHGAKHGRLSRLAE